MTDQEIIDRVSKWFGNTMSPGQVFDDLVDIRHRSVTWEAVVQAVLAQNGAQAPLNSVPKFKRPPPKFPPESAPKSPTEFKNPKPSFGPYCGKTLMEIMEINPGWVAQLTRGDDLFWARQAVLAQLEAQRKAPAYKDTDSGGFLQ